MPLNHSSKYLKALHPTVTKKARLQALPLHWIGQSVGNQTEVPKWNVLYVKFLFPLLSFWHNHSEPEAWQHQASEFIFSNYCIFAVLDISYAAISLTCKVETRNALSTARLAWSWDLKGPSNLLSCTKNQPDLYFDSFVLSNTTIDCNVSQRQQKNKIIFEESWPLL